MSTLPTELTRTTLPWRDVFKRFYDNKPTQQASTSTTIQKVNNMLLVYISRLG